jgi:hypothetical protein
MHGDVHVPVGRETVRSGALNEHNHCLGCGICERAGSLVFRRCRDVKCELGRVHRRLRRVHGLWLLTRIRGDVYCLRCLPPGHALFLILIFRRARARTRTSTPICRHNTLLPQLQTALLYLSSGYAWKRKHKTLCRPLIHVHGHGLIVGKRRKAWRCPANDTPVERGELGFICRIERTTSRGLRSEVVLIEHDGPCLL